MAVNLVTESERLGSGMNRYDILNKNMLAIEGAVVRIRKPRAAIQSVLFRRRRLLGIRWMYIAMGQTGLPTASARCSTRLQSRQRRNLTGRDITHFPPH